MAERRKSKRRSSPRSKKIAVEAPETDEYKILNFKPPDGYKKTQRTRQDIISLDKDEIRRKFEGFIRIQEDEYPMIQPNTYIRYLKDGKLYRVGGTLVLNKWPKYWLLKSTDGKNIKWSVPLEETKNIYFRKDMEEMAKLKSKKDKLYEAVMEGRFKLISPEDYQKVIKQLK